MKKLFYISISLIMLNACNNNDKPKNILDKDSYQKILKEILITDVVRNQKKVKDSLDFNPLELIYKKYKIDSVILKKNTDYYTQHPEILEEIYKNIKKDFKNKLDSIIKKDSTRNQTHKNNKKQSAKKIKIPAGILNKK